MKTKFQTMVTVVSLILCTGFTETATAQEKEIRGLIEAFFEGMRSGDSSMVHQTVMDNASLSTIYRNKEGKPRIVQEGSVKEFLVSIGKPHDKPFNEPVWNVNIKVDGDLAHVWCNYAFYLGNTFHHCGVNSFLLFNSTHGWKIFHIADTRRTTDCEIPEAVKVKFNK